MEAVLNLLNNQPAGYPRWRRGFVATSAGIQPTLERHLIVYEPTLDIPLVSVGETVTACRFMDGAPYVVADHLDALLNSDNDPHCLHCLEVELQHGLRDDS